MAATRGVSLLAVIAFAGDWHLAATGAFSARAAALLVLFVVACAAIGRGVERRVAGLIRWQPGIALDLLLGFFVANTLLFALMVVSPLGIGADLLVVAALAVAAFVAQPRSPVAPAARLAAELGSLSCILASGVAATLWLRDQQPVVAIAGPDAVFRVWSDVFLHGREISAFAQAHGPSTLVDIRLAGVAAPVYHFAGYMMPAALNALADTRAVDAFVGFQLPFGLLLLGLAAYVLAAVVLRTTWAAVIASIAVMVLPDADQQGFGIRYLSFHFMTQANPGMLYGIACISLAWLFMVEACRAASARGIAVAYLFLAACLAYKAHLFVANALVLMLWPAALFGRRGRTPLRAAVATLVLLVFVAAVALSQDSPRVPTIRFDASGIREYIDILSGGFRGGLLGRVLAEARRHGGDGRAFGALAALVVVFGSFGWWTVVAPVVLLRVRRVVGATPAILVAVVVGNYVATSMLLALDDRQVGAREELVNRPHAWAYFVVVVFTVACVVTLAGRQAANRRRVAVAAVVLAIAGAATFTFTRLSPGLQTFPEWPGYADYASFNRVPACLVSAARYVREHAHSDALLQDSGFDPELRLSALAERQAFVADSRFGGRPDVVSARISALRAVQDLRDGPGLRRWAALHGVAWYLLRPEDTGGWSSAFVDGAAFRCDGYRVFRVAP